MKRFSLEEYLKNPERNVVTGNGSEATIIFTKANKEWPVVALINNSVESGMAWQFSADGESMPDNDGSIYYGGLFFADEEEPLTEFEKKVFDIAWIAISLGINAQNTALVEFAKVYSRELLELAKKELQQEMGSKDLPRWKKAKKSWACAVGEFLFTLDKSGTMSPYWETEVEEGQYYITEQDILKLPKEE